MLYASHKPASFDLTGISPVQMEALVAGLAMLIDSKRMDGVDPYSDEFEQMRLQRVAAIELLNATKPARREAAGIEEDD